MNNLSVKMDEIKERFGFNKKKDNSELSLIELKSNENKSNDGVKTTNVKEFFMSVLKNLIYVTLWSIIGANFIFFMYSDLDACFPTDMKKSPYVPYSKSSIFSFTESIKMSELRKKWEEYFNRIKENNFCNKKVNSENKEINERNSNSPKDVSGYTCHQHEKMIKDSNTNNTFKIKKYLGFDEPSFPYTWNNETIFKQFFGRSAQYSYITNRQFLKDRMKTFSEFGKTTSIGEVLIFLLGFPLLYLIFLFQIPLISGFITTLTGEYFEVGFLISIFGIFAGSITFIYPLLVGFIQSFQLLLKFTLIPILINSGAISKIIKCKSPIIFLIFSILTSYSAFLHLETMYSIIVTATLLIMSIGIIYRTRVNLFKTV